MSLLNDAIRAVTTRYPLSTGCGRLADSGLLRWASTKADTVEWARLRTGQVVLVPPSDYVGRAIYYFGDLDPHVSWVFRALLRPGDTVLDIGANLGLTTLQASHLVGPMGHVHAFEPQPAMVRLMERSIAKNSVQNVTIHSVALGAESGRATLTIPEHNAGAASLKSLARTGVQVPVTVESASAYFQRLELESVRLAKIDVEGSEADVLEGIGSAFASSPPDALLVETGAVDSSVERILDILSALGYRLLDLPRRAMGVRPRPLPAGRRPVGHDLLALAPGIQLDRR